MNLTIGLARPLIPTISQLPQTDTEREQSSVSTSLVKPEQIASLLRMSQRIQQLLEIVEGLGHQMAGEIFSDGFSLMELNRYNRGHRPSKKD